MFETTIVAGLVGVNVTEGEERVGSTVQPRSEWWMFEEKRREMTMQDYVNVGL